MRRSKLANQQPAALFAAHTFSDCYGQFDGLCCFDIENTLSPSDFDGKFGYICSKLCCYEAISSDVIITFTQESRCGYN